MRVQANVPKQDACTKKSISFWQYAALNVMPLSNLGVKALA